MIDLALTLYLAAAGAAAPQQDTVRRLERAASSAAFHYESLLRRRAPERFGGGFGGQCDEIVGRFCFRFDDDEEVPPPPPPEHEDIAAARERAIAAHRRWFAHVPADPEATGPLIRYLIEADRPGEAAAAVRTHAWAADRSPRSLMLLGLALHHTADFAAAEAAFDSARAGMTTEERERLDDIEMLLEPDERRLYRDLDPEARTAFERRFWAFSDPSYLDAGNERRSAHYARHAWIPILEEAPRARGMISWGSDHEEILLRYGLPTSRERISRPPVTLDHRLSMIETYDPHSVSLVPAWLLTRGIPELPEPGIRHELERDTARASYAPVRRHRLRGLDAQVSLFPQRHGSVLRVDAVLPPDTVSPVAPLRPQALLVLLDTLGHEHQRVDARTWIDPDSATRVQGEMPVPPGHWVYRIEVADQDSTNLAGLSQYRVEVPPAYGLRVSDLLVAAPDEVPDPVMRNDLDPTPDLILRTGQTVLLFAEIAGLERVADTGRFAVEWTLESAESPSLLGRAVGWVGRQLGIGGQEDPSRVRWQDDTEIDPATVSLTLELPAADPGLYRLRLHVRDLVSGEAGTAERLIRLRADANPLEAVRGPSGGG